MYIYLPPAVWRWIGIVRIFCLCVHSVVICCFPLGVFRRPFPLLEKTVGSLGALRQPLDHSGLLRVAMEIDI